MENASAIQMDDDTAQKISGRTIAERPTFFTKATPWRLAGWIVFTALLCLHFCLTYVSNGPFLNMESYVQGVGVTPYQYRVLPMFVYRALLPVHAVGAVASHLPKPLNTPYSIILIATTFFCLAGAVLATAATIRRLTGDWVFARWMSLLVVYMSYFNLAPHWGLDYTLPYDVPSLLFFCAGVYLVISRRRWMYYVLFPIAVFNRETICFLTIFFLVWEWFRNGTEHSESVGRRVMRLLPHGIAQAAIWIGIKIYLAHVFASNPAETGGALFSGHLRYNLREIVNPEQWPVFLSICGFLLPALWLGRRWIRNAGMSWGCGLVMAVWFLGMLEAGVITEIRIFSEWTAFAVPALALIVYHRFLIASLRHYVQPQPD
jgi:hypothetical protein